MRTLLPALLAIAGAMIWPSTSRAADETPAKGKIVAVDLFKNGLAVVRCEVALGKPGTYVLEHVPHPVHGTFFVESAAPVEVVTKMREIEVPANETAPGNLQDDLAGKKVTVHLKGGNRPPVVGTMVKFKPEKSHPPASPTSGYASGSGPEGAPSRFLVVQTAKGRAFIEAAEVASVESEDAGDKVIRRRPRLFLTLGATDKPETRITLRYLTNGMTWAPSYRIDITDPKTLSLEQRADVRNELADLQDAEIRLISGFPSIEFKHVRSLLSRNASLAQYFAELGSAIGRDVDVFSNSIVTQNAAFNYRSPSTVAIGATPAGEGVDLHYQSIGKRTLGDGDTISLSVGKGQAAYERIVEWVVE
ncbi:MAG TPA: hypothetical protein VLM40_09375, partial [Gemmata sp.]|nr:hypothetical protein [Gemmata sp.]